MFSAIPTGTYFFIRYISFIKTIRNRYLPTYFVPYLFNILTVNDFVHDRRKEGYSLNAYYNSGVHKEICLRTAGNDNTYLNGCLSDE